MFRTPAITPERQPLATLSRNLTGQALPGGAETPLSKTGDTAAGHSVGTQIPRGADRMPDCGNGPSVADRGPFAAAAQGARYLRVTAR